MRIATNSMLSPRQKDHYAGVKRNGSGSSAATPRFLESDPQSSDDEEVELQSRIKNVRYFQTKENLVCS